MPGDGHHPIPVWTRNRGVQVMVRMALSQQGRTLVPVASLAELRKILEESRPRLVIAVMEDVAAAGLDAALFVRMVGDGCAAVLLSSARPLPETPGPLARVLPVPFTARSLLDALEVEA